MPSIVVDQPHQPQPQPQLPAREPARFPSPSIESQASSSSSLMPPKHGHQRTPYSPDFILCEPLYDTSIDTFTRYYASESNIDMHPHDAEALVAQLENNVWSGMTMRYTTCSTRCSLLTLLSQICLNVKIHRTRLSYRDLKSFPCISAPFVI